MSGLVTTSKSCGRCRAAERAPSSSYCRPCATEHMRERRAARPEHYKQHARQYVRNRKYGLSPSDYKAILASQGGCCAICGDTQGSASAEDLFVDHDHATGQVRGLLCNGCNAALGCMQDVPERLEAAAEYLRRTRAVILVKAVA